MSEDPRRETRVFFWAVPQASIAGFDTPVWSGTGQRQAVGSALGTGLGRAAHSRTQTQADHGTLRSWVHRAAHRPYTCCPNTTARRDACMPFVVTENCIKCKYTDCVEVCPVDCFHEGPNFLVIDPDECIDCTLCEPECPANAIFPEDDVPAGQENFIALNAELSRAWPVITTRKEAAADAKDWDGKPDKLTLLER